MLRRSFLAGSALASLFGDQARAQFSGGGGGSSAPSITAYYVNTSTGNDANPGTVAAPWASIAKVNASTFRPGDSILFQGAQTFSGAIISPSAGTPAAPITFGSYGGGQATISSSSSNGFTSTSQAGIVVRDLNFSGSAATNTGILFQNANAGSAHLQNIQAINCNVSGYGQHGIRVQQASTTTGSTAGYDNIVIEACTVSNCCTVAVGVIGSAGINITALGGAGYGLAAHAPSFVNVVISNCVVHDCSGVADAQWTGSGIVFSQVDRGTITGCVAYNNGASSVSASGSGPVGIWMFDSVNSQIYNCVSHDNKDGSHNNGCGFDLDGGVVNCQIMDCLSYNNDGGGFLVVQYADPGFIRDMDRASIVNCTSINDGIGVGAIGPNGLLIHNDAVLTNLLISGCIVRSQVAGGRAFRLLGGLPSAVTGNVVGNSFSIAGATATHLNVNGNPTGLLFSGNRYIGVFNALWNAITYTSLAAWRLATSQEPLATNDNTEIIQVSTPPKFGWNSAGSPSGTTSQFELLGGPNGLGVLPVPTLYPTNPNTAIALDLCPNGTATDLGYGVCWWDMTSTDQIRFGNVATSTMHLGVHTTSIFMGTGQYTAGTLLPFNFGTFNGDTAVETISFTINTDATVLFSKPLTGTAVQKAGLPVVGDIATGRWGVFKDTSGGGVYVAYNDSGTIKKVALT